MARGQAIYYPDGTLDDEVIRAGGVGVARDLQSANPDLGAILLECSDLPPYAVDGQRATGLPVFDLVTMIDYVHQTLTRRPYHGYL